MVMLAGLSLAAAACWDVPADGALVRVKHAGGDALDVVQRNGHQPVDVVVKPVRVADEGLREAEPEALAGDALAVVGKEGFGLLAGLFELLLADVARTQRVDLRADGVLDLLRRAAIAHGCSDGVQVRVDSGDHPPADARR